MQVEATSTAAAASGPVSSTTDTAQRAGGMEAGPSGANASADAHMGDAATLRQPRKHSDAPMRKLSVSLIDTYKLINQVSWNPSGVWCGGCDN